MRPANGEIHDFSVGGRPSRRVLYRGAKRGLYKTLVRRWTGSRASLERAIRAFLRGKQRRYLLRLVRQHALLVTVAAALLTGGAARASSPIELSDIAMNANSGGFVLIGEAAFDNSGRCVSGVGDVNGDGIDDLIVSAAQADPNGSYSGRSYVIFGKSSGTAIELSDITSGTGGFAINGEAAYDLSGISASGAGDVNGDGLDDLIVGAFRADPNGESSGRSYVVFGKASGTVVELSGIAAGAGGFVINGETAYDYSGISVSGAGDVNGDGLDDLFVGATGADPNGVFSGKSYVVFGKSGGTAVELSSVAAGTGGFAMNGEAAYDFLGHDKLSGAGDVNGDGLADLIVGAFGADPIGQDSGKSYVVFGKSSGNTVELSAVALGTGGFAIIGEGPGDEAGHYLSGMGDANGDGLDDLIIGAAFADPNGDNSGRVYVVFGKANGTVVALSAVADGTGGFAINGESESDQIGRPDLSGAGDVNGDGLADLIIGAHWAADYPLTPGKSYVVFGKADGTTVELSDVAGGTGGFVMNDEIVGGEAGFSVSMAGDLNGDGLSDVIVGARTAYGNATWSGKSYVVFSPETPPAPPATVDADFGFAGWLPLGTETSPFDTLQDATNKVATDGTITIEAGTTSETLTISDSMTIQASGGTVTIGGP